ncbi:conserved Plasmodium protein, unknown function [Plasmodium vivax]|uniref:Uncharacterized protein n=6 Tax=Plasmodium vivax TaxID=5855 RepID=A5K3V3_PLAVS|nr:hypothetical protein, conserved [Plasmodium vivax]KMZ78904.1 hypothetical protein PVIIG_00299 [Plasmodium vivax India VII]KMZ87112.1 hypothetical protein PVBG_03897 [Plasmodium vivax Brazil I]KMZ91750.1 hypothetical protein PVMG_00623 [Plasmodium vivax Mauritania I]KMZ97774.1 hypothetical protein PVNG_03621 [Plasmodium vivax North Korean]EDL46207.1 hypothetical protein, conserved [Plasmodium vivax]|eukprot:XP_001615934.1 hypothetical protein [Plasmodium vivax Sal-1]
MAAKIRYSVHTTNKYSVFDTDNSDEENENKALKEAKKREINSAYEERSHSNNPEKKKITEIKDHKPTVASKDVSAKKVSAYNDRYSKYPVSSINELHESSQGRSNRESYHLRGNNIRSKFPRKRGVGGGVGAGYSNTSTNILSSSNYYRGSRAHDYKMGTDRRNYNSSYNYSKFDHRERIFNERNDSRGKHESTKRETHVESISKNNEESTNVARKHDSVTIDYDLYRKQQEKKLISNKNVMESTDKKAKKNTSNGEKSKVTTHGTSSSKRNDHADDETKADHPKRKAINVYQYILEEGGRVDRIPGFRRGYRSYKKSDEANWNSRMEGKAKIQIDEKLFKKRDPPNINDARAFPSLTSK